MMPAAQCPIQIEGRADQGQMGEGLRKVAQGLAAVAGLLGVQPEVIGVTEHLLENQPGLVQPRRIACVRRG